LTELQWLNLRNMQADISVLSHLAGCQIITAARQPRRRL
jgi:hypothetical protein